MLQAAVNLKMVHDGDAVADFIETPNSHEKGNENQQFLDRLDSKSCIEN